MDPRSICEKLDVGPNVNFMPAPTAGWLTIVRKQHLHRQQTPAHDHNCTRLAALPIQRWESSKRRWEILLLPKCGAEVVPNVISFIGSAVLARGGEDHGYMPIAPILARGDDDHGCTKPKAPRSCGASMNLLAHPPAKPGTPWIWPCTYTLIPLPLLNVLWAGSVGW